MTRALSLLGAAVLALSTGGTREPPRAPQAPTSYHGFGAGAWPPAQWRPYADDSPFNRPIGPDDTVHPGSAAMVRRVLGWSRPANLLAGVADTPSDYDRPIYFARATDPQYELAPTRPWGPNPISGERIRVPAAARAAAGGDGHLTVVQPDGVEYDLWQVHHKAARGGRLAFGWGGRTRIDGDGRRSGATASGFGTAAGLIRVAELRAGRIDHALALVLRCTARGVGFGYGARPARRGDAGSAFVYPASKGATPCPRGVSDVPPTGTRFRLAMSDAQIASLGVPRWKAAILGALAHYGAYVADTGGAGFGFLAESGSSYTSFGRPDPLAVLARELGAARTPEGIYVYDIASGVDWRRYLRVITPPHR